MFPRYVPLFRQKSFLVDFNSIDRGGSQFQKIQIGKILFSKNKFWNFFVEKLNSKALQGQGRY